MGCGPAHTHSAAFSYSRRKELRDAGNKQGGGKTERLNDVNCFL